jgi:hypothetical protein
VKADEVTTKSLKVLEKGDLIEGRMKKGTGTGDCR